MFETENNITFQRRRKDRCENGECKSRYLSIPSFNITKNTLNLTVECLDCRYTFIYQRKLRRR